MARVEDRRRMKEREGYIKEKRWLGQKREGEEREEKVI